MHHLFNSYKGVIVFSGLKYLEIVITALTTFFLAQMIGPFEMGKAIPVLLYITYSTYLSLGVNQVIIKNYSEFEVVDNADVFLNINLQYHVLISLITIALAFLFIQYEFALLAGAISAATIMRSYFMAYFRVIDKIFILNRNNLIFSILLLTSVFTLVETWFDYLLWWAISIWISVIIYIFDSRALLKQLIYKYFFSKLDFDQIGFIIKQGVRLALLGATTTFLLTFDRIIISNTDLPLDVMGTYQLADYFGKAFYMIATTVLFYYYPVILKRLKTEIPFRKKYLKMIIRLMILIVPIILIFMILVKCIKIFYFKEYPNLEWFVSFNLLLKMIVFISSLLAAVFIALNKEYSFLRTNIPIVIGVLLTIGYSVFLNLKELKPISIMILVLLLITLAYQIYSTKKIINLDFKN
jgi:O-antigen/teichoic acid export membrane protein